jgi:bifunctional non-homologous end joining protein LigD
MRLSTYHKKRDFSRTPEPHGTAPRARSRRGFVIQKHDATRLHYDFRLELDGALLSWAVPKGPSLDPADKRLAVRTEDHPLEYARFEGSIPEGEYGGGPVLLWDRGTWKPRGDPHEDLRRGRLKFELQGRKLAGGWMLVRMGGRALARAAAGEDGKENWLLFKERDDEARTGRNADITKARPERVASGRRIEEIAATTRGAGSGVRSRRASPPRNAGPPALAARARRPARTRVASGTSRSRARRPGRSNSAPHRAAPPQGCSAGGPAGQAPPAACHPDRRGAEGRRVAARAQDRRLPFAVPRGRGPRAPPHAYR